ncbi:MAG: hypothetical protein CR966_01310 [Pseudomonadales bacterium]|nr:MAG: hypothetical protein CR966_01310 [Pseudomonadales bacterium]
MATEINNDLAFYKDFVPDSAKRIKHPLVKKLQARKQLSEQLSEYGFDDDVIDWLVTQEDENKHHVNAMIRHAIALQQGNESRKSKTTSQQLIKPMQDDILDKTELVEVM